MLCYVTVLRGTSDVVGWYERRVVTMQCRAFLAHNTRPPEGCVSETAVFECVAAF